MPDYSLLKKTELTPSDIGDAGEWDVFISAYNVSERVLSVQSAIKATEKYWVIHPEYGFSPEDYPASPNTVTTQDRSESGSWLFFIETVGARSWPPTTRICIDITGFMRPHLMFAVRAFTMLGFERLEVIYSDPASYASGEGTPFTKGAVTEVRQVQGYEGLHVRDAGEADLLIVGSGYDVELIRRIAEDKRSARKAQMFGLPSLQPHMYSENRIRAAEANEAMGSISPRATLFAPANDPFATAHELSRFVRSERAPIKNLYLSPLGTKPQALGFAVFYLTELRGTSASVIFPFAESYSQETSLGHARSWLYELELDWFK